MAMSTKDDDQRNGSTPEARASDPALDRRMAAFADRQSPQDLQDDFDLGQACLRDQEKLSPKGLPRPRKSKK